MRRAGALTAAAGRLRAELLRQAEKQPAEPRPLSDWQSSRSLTSTIVSLSRSVEGEDLELFVRTHGGAVVPLLHKGEQQTLFETNVEFLLCVGKASTPRMLAIEGSAFDDFLDFWSFAFVDRSELADLCRDFNRRGSAGRYRGPLFPVVSRPLRAAFIAFLEGLGINDGLANVIVSTAAQHEADLRANFFAGFASQLETIEDKTSFE